MPHQVGKEIISYCSSCKRDVMHTIVAMKEDRIVRVLCRSCKKEHAFRHAPDKSSPHRKPPARKVSPLKSELDREDWIEDLRRLKEVTAKPYAMEAHFEEGQKVAHRTFGTGVVKKLISDDKMEVLFESGVKVLVRNSPPRTSGLTIS